MSKVLVFSDWHIHKYGQFNDSGDRLRNCLKVLPDLAEFCISKDIKTILCAGDIYDTQKAILTEVVNETIDAFISFAENYPELRIISISGNHDHASKNLWGNPAITAQKHLERIIPNNFTLIDDSYVIIDRVAYYGIPYYEFSEHFSSALTNILAMKAEVVEEEAADFHYLMIHQTPKGLDNAMIAYDCNPKDAAFKEFNHVFCGHIHARQVITDNFTIVGSPLHRDMGDVGKQKGFLVFNSVKPEKGNIFIPLTGYPEFVEVTIGVDDDVEDSENFIVRKQNPELIEAGSSASVENFSTSLKNEELMENFWSEVEGKDEDLLKTGLTFLK